MVIQSLIPRFFSLEALVGRESLGWAADADTLDLVLHLEFSWITSYMDLTDGVGGSYIHGLLPKGGWVKGLYDSEVLYHKKILINKILQKYYGKIKKTFWVNHVLLCMLIWIFWWTRYCCLKDDASSSIVVFPLSNGRNQWRILPFISSDSILTKWILIYKMYNIKISFQNSILIMNL